MPREARKAGARQLTGRLHTGLPEQPQAELVLLRGLIMASKRDEQGDQGGARRFVVWCDPHPRKRMRQRAFRVAVQPLQQSAQQAQLGAGRQLALRREPGRKVVKIRQIEARERLAAMLDRGLLEPRDRASIEHLFGQSLQRDDVDVDVGRVQFDADTVGDEARTILVVDQPAQLREAPAQRAARVVRNLPEQLAQVLATKGAPVERQIGEQGTRLPRGGQLQAFAIPDDLEIAQKPELQRGHIG